MKAKIDNSNEVSLSEIFGKLRNHIFSYWLIYSLFGIIGFIGAKIYLRYVNPVYQVQATLLIKNENSAISGSGNKGGNFLSLFGPEKNIDDELEIIKSRQIIKDAIIKSNAQV
jgi:uncharacterized protein involved in exopolysaccharide biosynthesis